MAELIGLVSLVIISSVVILNNLAMSGNAFNCLIVSRIWTEYGEIRRISPYSVRMRENAGKNANQNNSEYGHFLRSVALSPLHWKYLVMLSFQLKLKQAFFTSFKCFLLFSGGIKWEH